MRRPHGSLPAPKTFASRDFLLTAVLTATLLSGVTTPLAGHISDRIGRKRMYLIGAVSVGVFASFTSR